MADKIPDPRYKPGDKVHLSGPGVLQTTVFQIDKEPTFEDGSWFYVLWGFPKVRYRERVLFPVQQSDQEKRSQLLDEVFAETPDHQELVKWLREFKGPGSVGTNEAADAVEALVKERDASEALVKRLREFLTPISDMPNPDGRGRYAETTTEGARIEAKSDLATEILDILDGAS